MLRICWTVNTLDEAGSSAQMGSVASVAWITLSIVRIASRLPEPQTLQEVQEQHGEAEEHL